jgi:hypothetical protein
LILLRRAHSNIAGPHRRPNEVDFESGSHVAIVCDASGNDTSFSDLDLRDARKADQRRLTPEPIPSIRYDRLRRAAEKKGGLVLSEIVHARNLHRSSPKYSCNELPEQLPTSGAVNRYSGAGGPIAGESNMECPPKWLGTFRCFDSTRHVNSRLVNTSNGASGQTDMFRV